MGLSGGVNNGGKSLGVVVPSVIWGQNRRATEKKRIRQNERPPPRPYKARVGQEPAGGGCCKRKKAQQKS